MNNFLFKILVFSFILNASWAAEATAYQQKFQSVTYAPNQLDHIKQRHWHNANSGPNTSRFMQSMTVKKLNAMATKTILHGKTSNSKNGNGKKVHDYRFQKPIGKTTNGKKAYNMRVVTNQKGEIITAFPTK